MMAPLLVYSLLGLALFYLQNLVFFPHVHLRLLALLLFYVGLRPSLALSLGLALVLGLLQDSYASTPLGLHLGGALLIVAAARFFRHRLLLQRLGPQVMGSLVALALQEGWFLTSTLVLGYQSFVFTELTAYHSIELAGTAALGPLMHLLVAGAEQFLRRFGWRPMEHSPYQPY
jgi:rod shape-determining protein MreD